MPPPPLPKRDRAGFIDVPLNDMNNNRLPSDRSDDEWDESDDQSRRTVVNLPIRGKSSSRFALAQCASKDEVRPDGRSIGSRIVKDRVSSWVRSSVDRRLLKVVSPVYQNVSIRHFNEEQGRFEPEVTEIDEKDYVNTHPNEQVTITPDPFASIVNPLLVIPKRVKGVGVQTDNSGYYDKILSYVKSHRLLFGFCLVQVLITIGVIAFLGYLVYIRYIEHDIPTTVNEFKASKMIESDKEHIILPMDYYEKLLDYIHKLHGRKRQNKGCLDPPPTDGRVIPITYPDRRVNIGRGHPGQNLPITSKGRFTSSTQ
ncbi:transmembrane protein [memana virus]|uniref:Transmembrane protein n=1 Tax=memana virus TaxID=2940997 RepID=A0AAE9KYK5_9MONO|nr:transmembrane protein [memana virus]